ncbi:MAG: rhodanese-like domain-containing protein [Bacteroidota bacterium]
MKNLFKVFVLFISISGCAQAQTNVKNLNPAEFIKIIQSTTNKQLLDVRTPEEWSNGKIKSSIGIDYSSSDFSTKIESLDKNKPVFVYCAAGGRSSKAAQILEKKGFKAIYNLQGGGYANLAQAGIK